MDEVIVLSGEFLFLQDGGEVKYSTFQEKRRNRILTL